MVPSARIEALKQQGFQNRSLGLVQHLGAHVRQVRQGDVVQDRIFLDMLSSVESGRPRAISVLPEWNLGHPGSYV